MCIIAVAKSRHLTEEEFKNCYKNNPDGFGMAWSTKKKNRFKKGFMNYEEAWNFYSKMMKTGIKFPYVCHFRIKTEGAVIPELTHPFIISRKSPLSLNWKGENQLLFHNGTVWDWEKFLPKIKKRFNFPIDETEISDSRALAMMIPTKGGQVIKDAGKYNKFVVFNKGKCRLFGDFSKEEGVYFSNDGYKYSWSSRGYYGDYFEDDYHYSGHYSNDFTSSGSQTNHTRYVNDRYNGVNDKDADVYHDILDTAYIKIVDEEYFTTYDIPFLEKELKLYKDIQKVIGKHYQDLNTKAILAGADLDQTVELIVKTENVITKLREQDAKKKIRENNLLVYNKNKEI